MAGNHRIAISLVIYLAFFGIALKFFLAGHHVLALAIVVLTWAALSAWLYFSDSR